MNSTQFLGHNYSEKTHKKLSLLRDGQLHVGPAILGLIVVQLLVGPVNVDAAKTWNMSTCPCKILLPMCGGSGNRVNSPVFHPNPLSVQIHEYF
jgi:hypothetical protein